MNNFFWKLHRLRAMSPPEIAHRVVEKVRKSTARGTLEGWERYANPGPVPMLPGPWDSLARAVPEHDLNARTTALLAGEFTALGQTWPPRAPGCLFPAELWRLDPVTGASWPGADAYCFDIPYRHERRLGDIKYVWEINRLQFLQTLAAQVARTGDPQALAAIEQAIASWYEANPPFRGLGWNSGIELALRAITLLITASLCGSHLSEPTVARLRALLRAHALWLGRYPSRFSSANNHRIAEAAGEFLIALALPEWPQAATLEARHRRVLAREAERQFHADGVPAEQSPTYGAFSAELLWCAQASASAAGRPLPAVVDARLAAFAEFIAWLQDAEGQVPAIGDDDEGRVLWLDAAEPSYPVSVCRRFALPAATSPTGLHTFTEGGYTVVREQRAGHRLALLFDHGPLGYLTIAAHGHADALAILVTLDGKPLFVDPGTYLYHSGGAWRDWFRGTRAHNTVNVDGVDQSRISGPFNWSHKARARLESARDGADWSITAAHDGYRKPFGVLHRRTLSATDQGFAIHDRLEGGLIAPARRAEIVFQLAMDCEARSVGDAILIRRAGRDIATVAFDTPGDLCLAQGGELGEGGGWISPRFGIKLPATRISWVGRIPQQGVTSAINLLDT
ncbi:heparinase II/III family protein [Thiorhodovibrio frisius]|uniref:Heparinase II/III-like protein n=1 Tax=Thiorhodovibrio frisius TaxID=631362 RepID=H8YYE2_9GAMM|nr:heparinase II/III family protein [Thiorhodovibrio frisius]EIC23468.1 Heparinase II/III-like protein [Thiorhodovibrio frisius]WPL23446.1 Heparinase II/III-like protein [Thiorhodovibrio frisius]